MLSIYSILILDSLTSKYVKLTPIDKRILAKNKFIKIYNNYTEILKLKSIIPEFNSIGFLNNDPEEIVNFLHNNNKSKVDYIHSLLRIIKMVNKYRIIM